MTTSCVFCKTPNVDYTCCINRGCRMCECCYKELFVETKYGFAPRNPRFNWHNCPECMREIIDLTWIDLKGHLKYKMSGIQYVKNLNYYYQGLAGLKYSN